MKAFNQIINTLLEERYKMIGYICSLKNQDQINGMVKSVESIDKAIVELAKLNENRPSEIK